MSESIHKFVNRQFGKDSLKYIRNYEVVSKKVADYRNHLRFNLRCLQTDIVPKSLRLKSRDTRLTLFYTELRNSC